MGRFGSGADYCCIAQAKHTLKAEAQAISEEEGGRQRRLTALAAIVSCSAVSWPCAQTLHFHAQMTSGMTQ
jgi:hypothetical protein